MGLGEEIELSQLVKAAAATAAHAEGGKKEKGFTRLLYRLPLLGQPSHSSLRSVVLALTIPPR